MENQKEVKGMFEGPLVPLLFRLSLPVLTGMFFQLILNIVDTLFVSRIDVDDPSIVGGVGLIFPVMFIFIAVASALQVGISSLIARSVGKRDTAMLKSTVALGFWLAIGLGVLLTLFGFTASRPLVEFFAADKAGDYVENGLSYLYWILPAGIFGMLTQSFVGYFQGMGFPKYIMVSMIAGVLVNIVLDPIFIYTFNLGISGAAIATSVSQVVSFSILFCMFLRGKSGLNVDFSPKLMNFDAFKGIFSIGFPMFLSQSTIAIAMIIYNKILISFDEVAMSAYTYVGRIDQAVMIPCLALSSALVTVVGQNFGRGNFLRVKQAWRASIFIGMSMILVVASIHVGFAPWIYHFMTGGNEEVTKFAVLQVRTMEFSFLLATIGIQGRGTFQGLGKSLPSVFLTIFRTLIFGLLFTALFVYVFKIGIKGVYLGLVCGNILISIVAFFWVEGAIRKLIKEQKA